MAAPLKLRTRDNRLTVLRQTCGRQIDPGVRDAWTRSRIANTMSTTSSVQSASRMRRRTVAYLFRVLPRALAFGQL